MRRWGTLALSALLAAGLAGARERSREEVPPSETSGSGKVARMLLGPVVLRSVPEGALGQTVCLEVWLGGRRMAQSCRKATVGQVLFHRIRLESRRSLPVTLRVPGTPVSRPRVADRCRSDRSAAGDDALLAQGLPDLVTSYDPEDLPRASGLGPCRQPGVPEDGARGAGGPPTCRAPVEWPAVPGEVDAPCGGWLFRVHVAPQAGR